MQIEMPESLIDEMIERVKQKSGMRLLGCIDMHFGKSNWTEE